MVFKIRIRVRPRVNLLIISRDSCLNRLMQCYPCVSISILLGWVLLSFVKRLNPIETTHNLIVSFLIVEPSKA